MLMPSPQPTEERAEEERHGPSHFPGLAFWNPVNNPVDGRRSAFYFVADAGQYLGNIQCNVAR